jgi:hypothetical protein
MTLSMDTQMGRSREPGHIETGDQVYLREAGNSNELRRLAFMYLHDSLGGAGPFTVDSIEGARAHIKAGSHNSTFSIALSSLTLDLPLSRSVRNPFAPVETPKSIKL